ncbi:hypothetical protein WOLCODRAFT_164987 [Wolfiporia cocos MD-104 SS10]|uniref:F-box domain-containing protein n=1 Tax=Wolfiporia cocos (strain MD-104) TaxID=742152 RepID=A0A2H3K243_WOLCO|nr:hypothetical protein WOLCODRAFT_164987 [Wolfiporia cocos MD-104 SS10]
MQNSAAFHRLDDDCLHEVLLIVSWISPTLSMESLLERRTFLAVTHVCTRWRNLTLASPRLWAFIQFSWSASLALIAEVLQRSASIHLHIVYDGAGSGQVNSNPWFDPDPDRRRFDEETLRTFATRYNLTAQLVSANAWRISSLILRNLNQYEWRTFRAHFRNTPTPQLQRLHLESHANSEWEWEWEAYDYEFIPCPHPALCEYSVKGPYLRLPECTSLTRLILCRVTLPTIESLVHTIRSNPLLEVLHIELFTYPREDLDQLSPTSSDPVHLPQLRHLNIRSDAYLDHVHILKDMIFPPSTTIELFFEKVDYLLERQRNNAIYCAPLVDILSSIDDLSVTISRDLDQGTRSTWMIAQPTGSGLFRVEWESYDYHEHALRNISALEFPRLHRLHLYSRSALYEKYLPDLLPAFPTISELVLDIRPGTLAHLLRIFQKAADGDPHMIDRVWPHLVRLKIVPLLNTSLLEDVVACFSAPARRVVPLARLELYLQAEVPQDLSSSLLTRVHGVAEEVVIHYNEGYTFAADLLVQLEEALIMPH